MNKELRAPSVSRTILVADKLRQADSELSGKAGILQLLSEVSPSFQLPPIRFIMLCLGCAARMDTGRLTLEIGEIAVPIIYYCWNCWYFDVMVTCVQFEFATFPKNSALRPPPNHQPSLSHPFITLHTTEQPSQLSLSTEQSSMIPR